MKRLIITVFSIAIIFQYNYAQSGTVKSISTIASGLGGLPSSMDMKGFGLACTVIGDLDKDGIKELVISATSNNLAPLLLLIFMNKNGTIKSYVEIAKNKGGFTGDVDAFDNFGSALATIGDIDLDGVPDLAVGSLGGDSDNGIVWILFMKADGTVKSSKEIKNGSPGFASSLSSNDYFGSSVSCIGDINKDTIPDLAVGAMGDNEGGALWVLLMKKDGTVKSYQKICNSTSTILNGQIKGGFGSSIAFMKDYNKDGKNDIAVGSNQDVGGAIYLLSINPNGSIFSAKKIDNNDPLLNGKLSSGDIFGSSVACFGDLDGDGMDDLAVGSPGKKYGTGQYWGKEYILLMKNDGTIKTLHELDNLTFPFAGKIKALDFFGRSSCVIPDINGDSIPELLIGSDKNDSVGTDKGIIFVCYMNGVPQVSTGRALPIASIDIFPNPAFSELKILLNSRIPDEINLINIQGQPIKQIQAKNTIQNNTITLDVSETPPGTYFIEIKNKDFIEWKKFFIMHNN